MDQGDRREPTRFRKGEGAGRGGQPPPDGPPYRITRSQLRDARFTSRNHAVLADPKLWILVDDDD